ncbi:MAG: hypothetical protein GXO75_08780 [Calditrichaeota bacterium]|nr:hypothetical protein [Calditrichota bacterium]
MAVVFLPEKENTSGKATQEFTQQTTQEKIIGVFERGKSKHRPRNAKFLFKDDIYPGSVERSIQWMLVKLLLPSPASAVLNGGYVEHLSDS